MALIPIIALNVLLDISGIHLSMPLGLVNLVISPHLSPILITVFYAQLQIDVLNVILDGSLLLKKTDVCFPFSTV